MEQFQDASFRLFWRCELVALMDFLAQEGAELVFILKTKRLVCIHSVSMTQTRALNDII